MIHTARALMVGATVVAVGGLAATGFLAGPTGMLSAMLNSMRGPAAALAEAPAPKPELRSVRVVLPEAAPGSATLTLSGRTAPTEQALISSRASGVVAERHVDIGDRVAAGAVLVTIDAPEVQQELLRARAVVDQTQARLELARVNLQRADSLKGQGHISAQTADERRANHMTAAADLAAAQAEVKRLEEVRSFQTVRAPFDGTIVARQVERGDKVSAESGQPGSYLLRIARMSELRVEVDVPQSSSLLVKQGAPARISFAELPGEQLAARVVRTAGLIEQASNTMRVELLMPNPEGRVPAGMNGQVVIDIPQSTSSVSVPTNTLITRDGRQMVALADEQNRVVLKAVSIARDLGERVVITAGLTVKDRVIVSPNALLRPGDEVKIVVATSKRTAMK